MTEFKDDEDGYLKWMRANYRSGSVLVFKTTQQAVLHAASCSHLSDDSGALLTKRRKLCASDSGELRTWAAEYGVRISVCSDC